MASTCKYYKYKYNSNIYKVDEFSNIYMFIDKDFYKLGIKDWTGYQETFYDEISEEEATLEVLND